MSDSMSISSSDSDDSNDSCLPITDEEWKQMESDLQNISLLQQDALKRMEQLSLTLSQSKNSHLTSLQSIIQQCHEQSLQDLSHTKTISFGQLLLQRLSSS